MTHYPQINALHRATRIKLSTTPAVVKLGNGRATNAKLHVVSVTGGLLLLARPLAEGDFIEVAFQTHTGNVQGMAEILKPVRASQTGVLQPFRFVALGDDDHRTLHSLVESANHRSFIGINNNWATRF
jgi:hypothetical protein